MTPELIAFILLAPVAIASALGMLFSKNAIYAAIFLILNFVTVAFFFVILGGAFIAITQVAVYAGAIMVLFLFVIMLLGAERLDKSTTLAWQKPLALFLGILLAIETIYVIFLQTTYIDTNTALPENFGSPSSIGQTLFQDYLLPFEITSVLLLVAMVGAIVLTRKR